jgi:hypothetical protein
MGLIFISGRVLAKHAKWVIQDERSVYVFGTIFFLISYSWLMFLAGLGLIEIEKVKK